MPDLRRFPILGPDIPPMLARAKIMNRLWMDLTKLTPSNLSLIGPRFIGKTVIMKALAQKADLQGSPYTFVLYWHLGHIAPASDSEFISDLCELLRGKLASAGNLYSEHCEYLSKHSFSHLKEITDLLNEDRNAILMIWDGFDKPLGQGNLTGHLWDQMRSIFYGKKHKIVTATRKPLSELIRREDAITSPFWNIFDMSPVRVEAFDEQDRDSIIVELSSHNFESGAKTELTNWSAGVPILFLEILNQITVETSSGRVDNEAVNRAAKKALEHLSIYIAELWQDCPAGAKDLYAHLVDRGEELFANIGKDERNCLLEKSFARQAGNKLTASCGMLKEHIYGAFKDFGSMSRLFGDWENYKTNVRGFLERRLSQISRFDEIYQYVELSLPHLPDRPKIALNNLSDIEDRALDLIWKRELGSKKVIPQELIDYWAGAAPGDKTAQRLKEKAITSVPADRWVQCGILQLLTGSKQGIESRAKHVTKDTYVLINALHSFRNRNQHSDGQDMHVGVAVAAIMTCLELLSCLERELKI